MKRNIVLTLALFGCGIAPLHVVPVTVPNVPTPPIVFNDSQSDGALAWNSMAAAEEKREEARRRACNLELLQMVALLEELDRRPRNLSQAAERAPARGVSVHGAVSRSPDPCEGN